MLKAIKLIFNKRKKKNVNLIICGLDNSGKTTLTNYLMQGEFTITSPTKKANHSKIIFPILQLNIFDLGGNEIFRKNWSKYINKTDGLIFVIDSSDTERITESKTIFFNILEKQVKQAIPILILLNKVDLTERIGIKQFLEEFRFIDIDKQVKWVIFETSVITGKDIQEAFQWIINFFVGEE